MTHEPTPAPSRVPWWLRAVAAVRNALGRLEAWMQRRAGVAGTPMSPKGKSSNELAEARTLLAVGRTMLAADRSLMAWIRTALSLMSFGFTIYKLLQSFEEQGSLKAGQSPRTIGLFLTAMGTAATVAGTLDYWHTFKQLRRFHEIRVWRPSFVFALVMGAVGTFLFFSIILKAF